MKKVRVTAKKHDSQNYIQVQSRYVPVFHMDGSTLTAVRPAEMEKPDSRNLEPWLVALPEAAEFLATGAFSSLTSLKSVSFGNTRCQLGSGVFSGCMELETASFPEGYEKIPLQTFADCVNLRQVRLPRSIKRINMDAFKKCEALQNIVLPRELEVIEVCAFWGCHSLEEIYLPDSLRILDDDAFANCTRLNTIRLSPSLQEIGSCAFQNCISLEEIVIPEGIKALPMGVFAGCRNLRHVVLPDTLEFISPYAFYQCDNLEVVECADVKRFARALECTPFGKKNGLNKQNVTRFPMELLNTFAGEVSGIMLTAMGYPWFDIDKKYRFFLGDTPGIIEVRSRNLDAEYPENALYEISWCDEELVPISQPMCDSCDPIF